MTTRRDVPAVADAKRQAKALRDFLAATGIEIKHTHALEAVAHIQHQPNFHVLRHEAAKTGPLIWIVNTMVGGMLPDQYASLSRDDALNWFARQVAIARVAVARTEIVVKAAASAPTGLYAFTHGVLIASLTALHLGGPSPVAPMFSNDQTLPEIADAITSLVWEDEGDEWAEVRQSVEDLAYDRYHWRRLEDEATRHSQPANPEPRESVDYQRLMDAINALVREPGAPE